MVRQDFTRSQSAKHVAREYERAKKLGITQKEFAKATGISSDRYLRKILKGERSGRIIEKRSLTGGVFNIRSIAKMPDGSEVVVSRNLRIPSGTSRLDIFKPKVQRAIRTEVGKTPVRDTESPLFKQARRRFRFNLKGTKFVPDKEVRSMPTVIDVTRPRGSRAA